MLVNPYLRALVGGIAAAIVVATPIVDDGLTPSEWLSIVGAFLSGTGLTALPPSGARPAAPAQGEEVYAGDVIEIGPEGEEALF